MPLSIKEISNSSSLSESAVMAALLVSRLLAFSLIFWIGDLMLGLSRSESLLLMSLFLPLLAMYGRSDSWTVDFIKSSFRYGLVLLCPGIAGVRTFGLRRSVERSRVSESEESLEVSTGRFLRLTLWALGLGGSRLEIPFPRLEYPWGPKMFIWLTLPNLNQYIIVKNLRRLYLTVNRLPWLCTTIANPINDL